MGDRTIPIKFGPEWLRNFSVERGTGATTSSANTSTANSSSSAALASNVSSTTNSPSTSGAATSRGATSSTIVSSTTSSNSPQGTSKVLLAKMRYGREEMLGLYDKDTADVPGELRSNDALYQTREKQPFALINSCEPEIRDNVRSSSTTLSAAMGDRQTSQRGRGMSVGDFRGKPRMPFARPMSGRASWTHTPGSRTPGYGLSTEDEAGPSTSQRPWTSSNGGNSSARSSTEQADWMASKNPYRSKRQGPSTNWRSGQSRDDDEWRPMEAGRPAPSRINRPGPGSSHSEKRDREWGERPSQEKSWGSNRRPWSGEQQTNEENLPEWALGSSTEACGGTFDSTGAFMGYNSDENSSLPRPQESTSYTSGPKPNIFTNLMRMKSGEEGSEEWWVSEKANKLSPKKFDASDLKNRKVRFQMPSATSSEEQSPTNLQTEVTSQPPPDFSKPPPNDGFLKESSTSSANDVKPADDTKKDNIQNKTETIVPSLPESKPFEGVRSDVEESNNEMKNFRSVMIPANNSLRQKHQNMVQPTSKDPENNNSNKRSSGQSAAGNSQSLNVSEAQKKSPIEDGLVNEIFEMALDEKEGLLGKISLPADENKPLLNQTNSMNIPINSNNNNLAQISNPNLPMMMSKQGLTTSSYASRLDRPNTLQKTTPMNNANIPISLVLPQPHQQRYESQNPVGLNNSMLSSSLANSVLTNASISSGLPHQAISNPGHSSSSLPNNLITNPGLASQGLPMNDSNMQMQSLQNSRLTNNALNASLGLPIMPSSNNARLGMPQPSPILTPHTLLTDFQNRRLQGVPNEHNSLFLGQNTNNVQAPNSELQRSNQQQNIFPMQHMPHSGNQSSFNPSMYANIMPQSPQINQMNLMEQWYYEDPEKIIQGPFTSQEMYNWYRAGFFSSSLMVKRACDTHMRPLGSYGPVVPFHPIDVPPTYPMGSFDARSPNPRESMLNSQSLGMDVLNIIDSPGSIDQLPYGSVNMMQNSTFNQPQMESLWGQSSGSASVSSDLMWMQQSLGMNNDARANHMNMLFWDQQPQTAVASKSILPEDITKEMKTEDQILAQLRATQNISTNQSAGFLKDQTTSSTSRPSSNLQEDVSNFTSATPNLNELQKLIQQENINQPTVQSKTKITTLDDIELPKMERPNVEQPVETAKSQTALTKTADVKDQKQAKQKGDTEKIAKNKENTTMKNKKKNKDEKKEETEPKVKDDDSKEQKRSEESSPSKGKKEEKNNKKEIEKEKKEWVREGFTIVKGAEKTSKENKKKIDEAKAQEEADRKRKEEEKIEAEEEKARKKQAEASKKQQDNTMQQQRQLESVMKKAPWSTPSQAFVAADTEGLTLTEIQRLEREKKLEQMKVQQQMIQIIAQQQAAALAREQEMQAGLGWAKKKAANSAPPGHSLADIQAETRKAAASSSVASVPVPPSARAESPVFVNHAPWGSSQGEVVPATSIGFWDTQPNQSKVSDKGEQAKSSDAASKSKKKANQSMQIKKESSPGVEFEGWCVTALSGWNSKIDVPTFIAFLKDVESPYEVKGYVKCYLGETKESTDFARQFLERRSKLLRVGMVTPSDDLCKPAAAVNPRPSTAEYQEVKGKTKKSKKNKMLKVDARILGFSVTAAEDRINVGDIDTV